MTTLRPRPTTRVLSDTDFAAPVEDRWFEDYATGAVHEYGYAAASEDEIVEFALRFDPQPFHIDRKAAAASPFGGIIASGWHTSALMMRLFADHYLTWVASLASPGLSELRWPAPVRPDVPLRLRTTTVEARASRSRPDRGIVSTRCELFDPDDVLVLALTALNMIALRPKAGPV